MSKHDKGTNKKNAKLNNTSNAKAQKKQVKKAPKKAKPSTGKRVMMILIPLLAVYFGGVGLFHKYFVPRTYFEGYSFSFRSPEYIAERLEEDTLNRSITLKERNGEETINLHESLDYEKSATAPDSGWIDKITPWVWPKYIFSDNELKGTLNVVYSEDKLESVVDGLEAMKPENTIKPADAYLARQGDEYVIVAEDLGTEIVRDRLIEVLRTGIEEASEELDLDELGCYTSPEIYSDNADLKAEYEVYKKIGFQMITLDMSGVEELLDTPQILELYDGEELSEEKVSDYVVELAKKYETYEEERPFVNHYGEEIMIGTGADTYGFLMDRDATYDKLLEALKSGQSSTMEPVWTRKGVIRRENGCDIGDTYIEIELSEQLLWAYKSGEQVYSTEVVTGKAGLFDTPRGVFQILDMAKDIHLKGEVKLPDGKKEKWNSFVNFWMAINWNGVGLHNAEWRSAFGGTIYQWDGSHGCINMDYDAAEFLYNTFDYGTPVIIW